MDSWHTAIVGGETKSMFSRASKLSASSGLMKQRRGGGTAQLDHREFNMLTKTLQLASETMPAPTAPLSPSDGVCAGWLLHQGKYRGAWKRAWFVLKPPYLFQYLNPHPSSKPKNTFYVSYVLPDRISVEDIASEGAAAQHMPALEEKACSLRILVYTPASPTSGFEPKPPWIRAECAAPTFIRARRVSADLLPRSQLKIKLLSAPSEPTLDKWLAEFEASVNATTRPEALQGKVDAVAKLKPLLMAQLCSEARLLLRIE